MILTAAATLQSFVGSFGSMALTPSTMLPLGTPLPQALLERERHRGGRCCCSSSPATSPS